MKSSFKISF